jgi:hypothetical protein
VYFYVFHQFPQKKPSHSPHSRSRQRGEAQQWKLAVELGQTALSNAIGNAISRSVVSNACRVAGQMSLLREVLGQLEEAGSRLSRLKGLHWSDWLMVVATDSNR